MPGQVGNNPCFGSKSVSLSSQAGKRLQDGESNTRGRTDTDNHTEAKQKVTSSLSTLKTLLLLTIKRLFCQTQATMWL